jgi:hypothetical protein
MIGYIMAKSIPVVFLFIMALADSALPGGWYSRSRQTKWVCDSLKRLDTLRIADSLHKADSSEVARYEQSDSMVAVQKKTEAEERKKTPVVFVDSEIVPIPQMIDNTSGRTIVIDPGNPYAKAIDSLQKVIETNRNLLHDKDSKFKEMKLFPISEKKRYIGFLLQNKLKDTNAIVAYCNALYEIYKTKQDLLLAIKNSQDPNTKNFIQHHIEEHRQKMAELSNFILAITPKIPYLPQREQRKNITDQ